MEGTKTREMLSLFNDVPRSEWFSPYVCMAKELGIIGGYPDGSFKPARFINFAESSKIIDLSYGIEVDTTLEPWYHGYVDGLGNRSAIPTTIDAFDQYLTRGEMAQMIYLLDNEITDQPSDTYQTLEVEGETEALPSPDLAVTDISLKDTGEVQFTVSNVGNEDIQSVNGDMAEGDVKIYFDDNLVYVSVLGMTAYDYGTEFYQSGSSTTFASDQIPVSGTEVKVCIESQDIISNDSDASNDCKTEKFNIDLALTELTLNDEGVVQFTVSNLGNQAIQTIDGDMGEGDVKFYFDDELVGVTVLGMKAYDYGTEFYQPGGETLINSGFIPESGTIVKVCLEPQDMIEGVDGTADNDCFSTKFSIDLATTKLSLNSSGEVEFTVSNLGNQAIQTLDGDMAEGDVKFYINDELVAVTVLGMKAYDYGTEFYQSGGETLINSGVVPESSDTFRVCLEPEDMIEGVDANEENNCLSVTF